MVERDQPEELLGDGEAVSAEALRGQYDDLRALARSFFQAQGAHTLQPTALVHEAFLKISKHADTHWESREHFFAVAAKAMRHILIDHARAKNAEKREGGHERVTLSGIMTSESVKEFDALDIDDALTKLARVDQRQAKIVELRFFVGLTIDEVADLLSISPRTAQVDWRMAKAWLRRELDERPA